MTERFRLEIDRARWRCGGEDHQESARGVGPTKLLNKNGFMCCLGFRTLAASCTAGQIRNYGTPAAVCSGHDSIGWKEGMRPLVERELRGRDKRDVWSNTDFCTQAMEYNDADWLSDEDREKKLVALARQAGEEWVFVGEYPEKEDK